MLRKYELELHSSVERFKNYQKKIFPDITEDNDNGEWVFGFEFDDIRNAYLQVINSIPSNQATDVLVDDLLYIIARDNECSSLMVDTLRHPEWFSLLCKSCLQTQYTNAKWQFAEHLHEYRDGNEIRDLIFSFLETGDEYTERMALQSLSEIYPEHIERYAVSFWDRQKYDADEYQKMMVLYVLDKVNSPLLKQYLALADKTEYQYLKEYAEKIRHKND